ncbi:hypothetical protein [Corynebacterium striatum]|uniref:hypothetical protein n=1 Tax=Corynebacterium striatum TaxID=43770 RepID=UPI003B5C354E
MRIRSIKPEFWDSPSTARADLAVRLVYIAMWNWADDSGHGTANLKELEAFCFPNDDVAELPRKSRGNSGDGRGTWRNFAEICGEVAEAYGIKFYKVHDRPYYVIPNFKAHQSKDFRPKSKYPTEEEGYFYDVTSGNAIDAETGANSNTGTSGDSSGNSATSSGKTSLVTGEQGNRGTGEGVEEISDPTGYPQPVDKSPQPQNLDELAAATAASNSLVCSRHPDGNPTGESCWECGQVKKRRQETGQQARDEAKAQRRAAIDACNLCDDNGIRYANGQAHRCTHKPEPPF